MDRRKRLGDGALNHVKVEVSSAVTGESGAQSGAAALQVERSVQIPVKGPRKSSLTGVRVL
eukprot:m.19718 g.19718  ORF g.19718 m.19718 type:complete len:61 (-) comp5479_c0_seq1:14-196(-)